MDVEELHISKSVVFTPLLLLFRKLSGVALSAGEDVAFACMEA
jgi:hypothetical protein